MSAQLIELLVLFAIAAFVLYRLKSVLGTRTGYEEPPEYLRRGAPDRPDGPDLRPVETAPDIPDEEDDLPDDTRAAVARMRELEPDFTVDGFLGGARAAYEMILMAYEEGDRETLKSLLAPDVYTAFEQVIDDRDAKGLRVDARFIGVRETVLTSAAFDESDAVADLTVQFTGEIITAVRDAENRIVEGDPNEIRRQTDRWTFSRRMGASDPNWLLTATGG